MTVFLRASKFLCNCMPFVLYFRSLPNADPARTVNQADGHNSIRNYQKVSALGNNEITAKLQRSKSDYFY